MSGFQEEKKCESVQDVTVQNGMLNVSRKRKQNRFCIYAWLDPRKPGKYKYKDYKFDYEPIYIGKGNSRRPFVFNRNYNSVLTNKLRQFPFPIIVLLKKELSSEKAFLEEIKMITTIGRYNIKTGPLCNLTDGGEGCCGYIPTLKHRQNLSKAQKGRPSPLKGKTKGPCSDKHKQNISRATKGKHTGPFTKEHCQNISKARLGKPSPLKGRKMTQTSPLKGKPGHPTSEETKKKLRLLNLNKVLSKETRLKMSEGKSYEERSETAKKGWAKIKERESNSYEEFIKNSQRRSESTRKWWAGRKKQNQINEGRSKNNDYTEGT